jgi:hypothetical protein
MKFFRARPVHDDSRFLGLNPRACMYLCMGVHARPLRGEGRAHRISPGSVCTRESRAQAVHTNDSVLEGGPKNRLLPRTRDVFGPIC